MAYTCAQNARRNKYFYSMKIWKTLAVDNPWCRVLGDHVIETFFEVLASAYWVAWWFFTNCNKSISEIGAGKATYHHAQARMTTNMTHHWHHLHQCDIRPSGVTFDSTCEGPSSLTQRSKPSTRTAPFSLGTGRLCCLNEVLCHEIACLLSVLKVGWLDATSSQGRIP